MSDKNWLSYELQKTEWNGRLKPELFIFNDSVDNNVAKN